METTKYNALLIGAFTMLVGLIVGYGTGTSMSPQGHTMNTSMSDAMHTMSMSLDGKTGDALDEAFLSEMIVHHQGAIDMAHTLRAGTTRPELMQLATDIVTAQTKEIKMMQQWQQEWFGNE